MPRRPLEELIDELSGAGFAVVCRTTRAVEVERRNSPAVWLFGLLAASFGGRGVNPSPRRERLYLVVDEDGLAEVAPNPAFFEEPLPQRFRPR